MAQQQRLKVEIPSPAEDRPQAVRVGLIVLLGALFGVGWPLVVGTKLVPVPPGAGDRPLPAASAEASASAEAPPPAPSQTPPPLPPAPLSEPEAATSPRLRIGKPAVTRCRDKDKRRMENCDPVAFDRLANPRLAALEQCPAVRKAQGVFSVGFDLDFSANKITRIASGKSTTLPAETTRALIACVKREFSAASLEGIQHDHPSYTIFFRIDWAEPAALTPATSASAGADAIPASGSATVTWAAAIIRNVPSKEGRTLARVLSGTRLTVIARQGEWYRVKYDAKGSEGWVYRGALGL